jgi:hypothetical protein
MEIFLLSITDLLTDVYHNEEQLETIIETLICDFIVQQPFLDILKNHLTENISNSRSSEIIFNSQVTENLLDSHLSENIVSNHLKKNIFDSHLSENNSNSDFNEKEKCVFNSLISRTMTICARL